MKNGLTTSFLFFLNAKNLGRSEDAKRRKKENGLIVDINLPSKTAIGLAR